MGSAAGLLVEEQHIALSALLVENAGGQAEDRVEIELVEQALADFLAGTRLEQHVVRHDHRADASDLQARHDMLEKIELLVGCRHLEIGSLIVFPLGLDVTVVGEDLEALLAAEGRIGEDIIPVPSPV